MMSGHQIVGRGRTRPGSARATGRLGRQWPQPEPERFDTVRAKIATDLAGLLILLSMVAGSLVVLG